MRNFSPFNTAALLVVASLTISCGAGSSTTPTTTNANTSSTTTGVVGTTPFSSDEGRFKVTLPPGFATFKESKNERTGWVTNLSEDANGNTCAVSYRPISDDLAKAINTPEKAQKVLEIYRDDSIKGMTVENITPLKDREEKITVQGQPGLSQYGSLLGGEAPLYFRMDNILAKSRGYRIGCFSLDQNAFDKPEMQIFFRSLQLTE